MNDITIKDISKLMRVTTEAIRFFERRNIIVPKRGDQNGYRYFTQDDIRRLYDCKIYQELGFSIAEVVDLFNTSSGELLDMKIHEKEQQMMEAIENETRTLSRIRQVKQAKELLRGYSGTYYIVNSPHLLAAFHSERAILNRERLYHRFYDRLADHFNHFSCTALISLANARCDDVYQKMSNGYSIEYESGCKLGLCPDEIVMEFPSRRCVYTVFHAEPVVSGKNLEPILKWVENANMKATGDIICRTQMITFNEGKDSRIYEAWLPIED